MLKLYLLIVLALNIIYTNAKLVHSKHPFLRKFHEVVYKDDLAAQHLRSKRSTDRTYGLQFKFDSHGRHFELQLEPTKSMYAHKHIEMGLDMHLVDELVHMYTGRVADEPGSKVDGTVIEGAFIGTIVTERDGTYHVEPAARYDEASPEAHVIVYHDSDMVTDDDEVHKRVVAAKGDPNEPKRELGCGLSKKRVRERLMHIQDKISKESGKEESAAYKYSKNANQNSEGSANTHEKKEEHSRHGHREKRATNLFPNGKSECSLYLKADQFYYNMIYNAEGKSSDSATRSYIAYYLNQQVVSLNALFQALQTYTSNQTSLTYLNSISFRIYKTKVITPTNCATNSSLNAAETLLCNNYLDSVTFLNDVSMDNYNAYCLSFTFTARDFSDGSLGLAWIASTTGSVGGLCQQQVSISGNLMSLNSGIVTHVNYGVRTNERANQLTFSHEVGHGLGSQHDLTSACQPGGSSGNYIMYPFSSTFTLTNNQRYSPCSIAYMNPTLQYIATSSKNCLSTPGAAICGNGIVETGEACDYGSDAVCCTTTCTLATGAVCSSSVGACCTSNCTLLSSNTTCSTNTSCKSASYCDGKTAVCPTNSTTTNQPDLTPCNDGTQVCVSGVCTGSICTAYGLTQCYLSGSQYTASQLCHLACTGSATGNVCTDVANLNGSSGSVLSLTPGAACNNTQGYCDVFSICRTADGNALLKRLLTTLTNFKLNPLQTIGDIALQYWWAILIVFLAFLAFSALIIALLILTMESDNPHHRKAHKIVEVIQHPIRTLCLKKLEKSAAGNINRRSSGNSNLLRLKNSSKPAPRELAPSGRENL